MWTKVSRTQPLRRHRSTSKMPSSDRKTIRFRGKTEAVLDTIRLRGRNYFVLESLAKNSFRAFDPNAMPGGDYRVIHRFPTTRLPRSQTEVLRRLGGPNRNPNFPGVVEIARQNSETFVVLGWVHGTGVDRYLSAVRNGKTPAPSSTEVVRLVRGLVHGVGHYHRATNMVHGDISPANIIITDRPRRLVLIDFGSAWPVEKQSEGDRLPGVTLPYAAPERLTNDAPEDFRADVFSLSAIAYELLTLEVPYEQLGGKIGLPQFRSQADVAYRDATVKIDQSHRIPTESLRLVDRCLRKGLAIDPAERFSTTRAWLSTWDELWHSFNSNSNLTPWQRLWVRLFHTIADCFPGKS